MFLLVSFLIISILFRKAFCSWLCPIGTISEGLWKFGRKYLGNWRIPRWIDIPFRGLKYLLLSLFLYAVAGMSTAAIGAFMGSPYGLVADVKMLNFFRFMGQTAAITIAAITALSILFQNFWCRYLCPYGALMGLASLVSPSSIRRDTDSCVDCTKCAKACPSLLPVDKLLTVRSAECTACMECVAVCPARDALRMSFTQRRGLPPWALAAGIAFVFFATVLLSKYAGWWETHIPGELYQHLIPRAQTFTHP
jgi:polyferredoxin